MSALREAAKQALEEYDRHSPLAVVMEDLRTALAEEALQRLTDVQQEIEAALEQQADPVAWRYQDAKGHYRYRGYIAGFDSEYAILKPVPLYTAPHQRKLLTGEQIEFAWMKAMQSTPGTTLPIHEFARAIEQAHGIKGEA